MPSRNRKTKPKYDYGSGVKDQKDRVKQQQGSVGIGPGSYDRWTQDGHLVYYNTITNNNGIEIPDEKSGFMGTFTMVPGYKSKIKDIPENEQVIIKGLKPRLRILPQETIIVHKGDSNYNKFAQELINEMRRAGKNAFVGSTPELPYNLPNITVIKKDGGTLKRLIAKHYGGKTIERQDGTKVNSKEPKRNLDKEQFEHYKGIVGKSFPVTFEDVRQDLINAGILPPKGEYSMPPGHLGDGYQSITISPEIKYGPYDLPQVTVNGWGRTLDPEYSEEEWKNIARKTIQNDTTLSLADASRYMWALEHPEFKLHPMFRPGATPIQPGPWDRVLYTSGEYEGYLPSDNPKYGGEGKISWDWDYPARSITYKTTKYPPEDWNNKKHLYYWLDKFYNRMNGLNK